MARPIARFALHPQQERALRHAPRLRAPRSAWRNDAGSCCTAARASRGLARNKVGQWERRFAAHGLAGLKDKPGRGRKSTLDLEKKARVLTEVTPAPPWGAR